MAKFKLWDWEFCATSPNDLRLINIVPFSKGTKNKPPHTYEVTIRVGNFSQRVELASDRRETPQGIKKRLRRSLRVIG